MGFKAGVGFLAHSLAVILDAVNNLSDALSSLITIVGTKLSSKAPDKDHPFGYGRIEYFSSVIIAVIILIAGLTSLKESFLKIITPEQAEYSLVSLGVIMIAVFVKFFFGKWVKKQGQQLHSWSLVASGTDALSDAILSSATFIGAVISYVRGISLEGYLGVLISVFILKAAREILQDTIKEIMGTRADFTLTQSLKKAISKYPEIQGVYDLTVHNYGPNKMIATAHIQIPDEMLAKDLHMLTKKIQTEIFTQYGIVLTLGIYAANQSWMGGEIQKKVKEICKEYHNIIQIHGFYLNEESKEVSFDVVFNFDEKNPQEIIQQISQKLSDLYPHYHFSVIIDTDFSES